MSKLSLEALKERAGATASNELLETISGGLENTCHDGGSGIDSGSGTINDPYVITPVVIVVTKKIQ